MRRRDLLAATLAGLTGLCGCSAGGGGDPDTETASRTDTSTPSSTASPTETSTPSSTASPTETSTPAIERTDFDISDISCGGGGESATVEVDDGFVRVEGVAVGRNTCYRAELDGVRFEDGTVTVAVRTFSEPHTGETCGQCLVDIDYRVLVRYRGRLDRVVVRHDGAAVARREVG